MVWRVGYDSNGDGIACIDMASGDVLNSLYGIYGSDHTDYTNIPNAGVTPTIVPMIRPFGRDAFRFELGSGDSFTIFDNLATTLNTRHYAVVFWYRMISQENDAGVNVTTPYIYSNGGLNLEATGSALGQSTDWTQASISFQPAASTNLRLRLTKNVIALTSIIYEISGLMILSDTVAVPVPTGYNAGATTDQYDLLNSSQDNRVLDLQWEGGLKSYDTIAGEKKAIVLLSNTDKRFSPDNASSPLYGELAPGRVFLIYYGDEPQYTGYTDLLTPEWGVAGSQTALWRTTNLVSILKRNETSLEAVATKFPHNIISAELLRYDLRLYYMAFYNDTLNSEIVIPYYGDNGGGGGNRQPSLWTAFEDLADTEWGKLYISKAGIVTLLPRSWDVSSAGGAVALTLDNTAYDIRYTPTAARIITKMNLKIYPREVGGGTSTLWTLRKAQTIPAGETTKFVARYKDSNKQPVGATGVITPAGADYVTAGGSPTLTFTPYGELAVVEIDNSAGATDCTLSTMVIKGTALSTFEAIELTYENEYLMELYGKREASFDMKGFDSLRDAKTFAKFVFPTLALERGEITDCTIMSEDNGTDNATQIALDVGSQVSISDDQLGITDWVYNVVGYKHRLDPAAKSHTTTLQLEIAHQQTFWILGVSRLGLETRLGR